MPNNQIKSLTVDGTTYDLVDETSGYITGMTILSYGSSTWQDFIDAYNSNKVVYCRASSNSNPGTGQLNRLAFLAYVDNADQPTSVEFQYYRSVSTHSESQQGDQVFVYTLTSSNSWSVTTREAATKIVASGDLTSNYNNGTLTISANIADTKANAGFGVSEETDFDDILTDGRYWIDASVTLDNAPISADGLLEVITTVEVDGGNVFQRFSVYNSDKKYWRTKANNTWTEWFTEEVVDISNKANAGFGTSDATDFDDILVDGRYWIDPNVTAGHAPSATAYGVLEVIRGTGVDSGAILQRYTVINSPAVYERMYGNGQWYPWYRSFGKNEFDSNIANYSNGLGHGTMPSVADLDDYKDAGVWWVNALNTKTNLPNGASYGFLEVMMSVPSVSGSTLMQKYTQYNIGRTWHRGWVNNKWTEWMLDSGLMSSIVATVTISTNNSAWTNTSSTGVLTLPRKGNYIVFCTANYVANATGRRALSISTSSSNTTSENSGFYTQVTAVSGGATVCKVASVFVASDDNTKLYPHFYQNSGGTLNVTIGWQWVRIIDS